MTNHIDAVAILREDIATICTIIDSCAFFGRSAEGKSIYEVLKIMDKRLTERAATQPAGEVVSNTLWKAEPSIFDGGKLTVDGRTIALIPYNEANRIACEHNDAIKRLAAPISEDTGKGEAVDDQCKECGKWFCGAHSSAAPISEGDALPPPTAWRYHPKDGLKHPAYTEREAQALAYDAAPIALFTADQMRAYVLADRAARTDVYAQLQQAQAECWKRGARISELEAARTVNASIGDDAKFKHLVQEYGVASLNLMDCDPRDDALRDLVAYIDQWSARTQLAAVEPAKSD